MLTKEQIAEVKNEFIKTLRMIKRPGCDVEGLISMLESSDFFDAPASTKYHCSFEGGLALHSLNVYESLVKLNETFEFKYDLDSLIIVGLLHDVFKINFYEPTVRNEKVYNAYGKKMDELGAFDWVSTKTFRVKEPEERNILGSKGFTAYYIISEFISLTSEETATLVNQYSATDRDPINDLSTILSKNNLAVLLHSADIISTFCIEK